MNITKFKYATACIFFCILLITACSDPLYFDSAPKSDIESIKTEFKKWGDFTGVYKLNISYLDSIKDEFPNNRYDHYVPPALKKDFDDTLKYFSPFLFTNRYLEITEHNGVCHFLNFDCVNKKVFDQFFSNGTRIIKEDGRPAFSVSAIFKNDSIHLKIHSFGQQKELQIDTIVKFKALVKGELIFIFREADTYFQKSLDINSNDSSTFRYFLAINKNLYFVVKDTSHGKEKFEISNLQFNKNGFTLRTLYRYETADTILKKLGVKFENDLVHYNESQLASIFNSSLVSNEVVATRIEGFPMFSEDSASTMTKYWLIIGVLVLILFSWVLYKKRKNNE